MHAPARGRPGRCGPLRRARRGAALALFGVLAACGGGGGGADGFEVVGASVAEGQSGWEINRVLRVRFSAPVDPASVTFGTVSVRQVSGLPAIGTLGVDPADPAAVLWRPACPTLEDLSDAGLAFGIDPATGLAHQFELALIGADGGSPIALRSASGVQLERSFRRRFSTPVSTAFGTLFVDDGPGPPAPVVRPAGSIAPRATHLLIGGAAHYFERQPDGSVRLEPPLEVPLNLYSRPAERVELELFLDQSVDMRAANLNDRRLRLEFEAQPGDWRALASRVTLLENCGAGGARVRLEPRGLLPPGVALRAVVDGAFADLVGQASGLDQDAFAPALTVPAPTPLADHWLEGFADGRNEDPAAAFGEPRAPWGAGELAAAFSFTGTGGPGGDFDFAVRSGQLIVLNTVQATLVGGPGYAQQKQQVAVGGVFDLRNLLIEAGGVLKFEGPNPVVLLVSGELEIQGSMLLDGTPSKGVQATNTTALPELGAPGQAGGGRGGTGSYLTSAATPRGGPGYGPFDLPALGGQGGETGYGTAQLPQSRRRGAGGGGGRLGLDVPQNLGPVASFGLYDQSRIGLDAEPGFDNTAGEYGVFSGPGGPRGGAIGPGPFADLDPTNDFFGVRLDLATSQVTFGELQAPSAGAGGGAGGDASFVGTGGSYPPKWSVGGDEKGSGGGGGGGSLRVLALGDIRFVGNGRINARGGSGGGGENNNRFNRVGGGSGGGSGGHVVLETASAIDMRQASLPVVVAIGGQGGAGADDRGGAYISNTGPTQTNIKQDACPPGYPGSGTNACLGQIDGAGGDGGPGIVQLETSSGTVGVDILLPAGAALADACSPPPLGAEGGYVMLPSFGRFSRARSVWFPLGEGGHVPGGPPADVRFDFGGLDPAGYVLGDGAGGVQARPPLLAVPAGSGGPTLGRHYVFDAAPLAGGPDQVLLDHPELLDRYLVELRDSSAPSNFIRFAVATASYDPASALLSVDLDPAGPPMDVFVAGGPVAVELQPASFRLTSDGTPDRLPGSTAVQIRFEATGADPLGAPLSPPTVPWTSDVADLNTPGNGALRFVRFEVLFDVDRQLAGLTPSSPLPALDFLRLPFRYP